MKFIHYTPPLLSLASLAGLTTLFCFSRKRKQLLLCDSLRSSQRARILSIYQGCFLVVFLFLLYMLFSVLSYSIWFSDRIPVIDSLLVAIYTITTVGYGNQQPTSNPALAFTIWEVRAYGECPATLKCDAP